MTNETGTNYEKAHTIVLRHRKDLQGAAEDETGVDMKKLVRIARSGDPEQASDIYFYQINYREPSDTRREEYDDE